MPDENTASLIRRFRELAETSDRDGIFTFTDFLAPADAALALTAAPAFRTTAFGGTDSCERTMVRYGNPEELGYEMPFPIAVIRVTPRNERFSEDLTHRDFLGAVMNLGIRREMTGDILVREGKAYLFTVDHLAPWLAENLRRVRHTDVDAVVCGEVPEDARPRFETVFVTAAGERLDGILSRLLHLSRGKAKELFDRGYVHLNGRECTQASRVPKINDIISVRGFGKFVFRGQEAVTKKGNEVIRIDRFL